MQISEKLLDRLQSSGLRLYIGQPDDELRLVDWWLELRESNELQLTFPQIGTLTDFICLFRTNNLLYARTSHIRFAAWIEPFMNKDYAVFSSWVAKQYRGSKKHLECIRLSYEIFFSARPYLVSFTHSANIIDLLRKVGYIEVGELPGEVPLWTGYITEPLYRKGGLKNESLQQDGN